MKKYDIALSAIVDGEPHKYSFIYTADDALNVEDIKNNKEVIDIALSLLPKYRSSGGFRFESISEIS